MTNSSANTLPDGCANALDSLPSLPSGMDFAGAGLWAGSVLMQAAVDRKWDRADLRQCLLTMAVFACLSSATDERFHADLQATLDRFRARRALKS